MALSSDVAKGRGTWDLGVAMPYVRIVLSSFVLSVESVDRTRRWP
jgi:hypothetical protein